MLIKWKRVLAALIDYACVFFISTPVSFAIFYQGTNISAFYTVLADIGIFALLFAFRDLVFQNASIGKKVMKLHIVYENGERMGFETCVLRAIPLVLVPLEITLILKDNYRIGDMISKSWVEDAR